ncbi:hypothetical protein pb186bvf_020192 [Paramecium bursaria]
MIINDNRKFLRKKKSIRMMLWIKEQSYDKRQKKIKQKGSKFQNISSTIEVFEK